MSNNITPSTEIINVLNNIDTHNHQAVDYLYGGTQINNVSNWTATENDILKPDTDIGNMVESEKYNQILDVLQQFIGHTHVFYDDYSTNCNCNCNCCNAIRGAL